MLVDVMVDLLVVVSVDLNVRSILIGRSDVLKVFVVVFFEKTYYFIPVGCTVGTLDGRLVGCRVGCLVGFEMG